MKKYLLLFLSIMVLSVAGYSQPYAISATFQHYFTKQEVDSVLVAQLGSLATQALTTTYGVRIYKVEYNTFDADSIPTTASGLLVVPQSTPCEVPILSFEHNNIIKKSDAPSRYSTLSQWYVGMAAGSMMPDGIGLGDGPGLHPFLHLQSEATSVIDMIRAVKEFVDTTGNSPNDQLFLAGIAEGAYAALAAHQYIQAYLDSSMHVTATGGIAGYYDMSGTMVNMILSDSVYPDPSYLPELMLGYNKAYRFFANDSDLFAVPYDTTIPPLFNGNNRATTIDARMPSVPKYVLRQDQIDSLQDDSTNYIRQLLAKNDLFNWSPTSPVYLLYCIADEYVPFQNSIVAYTHFVQNGSTMVDTLDVGATDDHATCSEFSVLSAVSLINELIYQPLYINVTATSSTSPTVPNGTAMVSDTFGDPPYTFLWSTGDTGAAITGLAAGTYYVTTTDRAHCTKSDSVVVQLADGIAEVALTGVSVYPNPSYGLLMIDNQNAEKISRIEISDISGNVIIVPQSQQGVTTTLDLGEEARGIYFLNITSQSGKALHKKVVLL
jgi:hypothetical protein